MYSSHQTQTIHAISMVLGDNTHNLPAPCSPDALKHWLSTDGHKLITHQEQARLLEAHSRAHQLIDRLSREPAYPMSIETLHEMQRASDTVSRILTRCIDRTLIELAMLDPLTKIRNRTTLPHLLQQQQELARKLKQNLGIILIDIDHFKRINDSYGHSVGDLVLQELPQLLEKNSRAGDVLFRWGGEEFVIIGTATPGHDNVFHQMAERLCRTVEASSFGMASSPLFLTVSAGVAESGPEYNDPQALFDQADQMLALAKRSGRNQVRYSLLNSNTR